MKHFTFKQCAVALCLSLASFLPGQSIATNAPDVSSPIGMELAEDEGNEFSISMSSLHQYKRAWVYNGSCDETVEGCFYINLKHPSGTAETAYLKLSLNNPTQRSSVTFRVNEQDRAFDENGSIWITPEDDSKSENLLEVPFIAKVTAPGAYPYTVEAYVNQNDQAPVAKIDAAFYLLENMPELSFPSMLYDNQFKLQVKKGDLEQINAYVVVELFGDNGAKVSFAAEGFTPQDNQTDKWENTSKPLVDEVITGTLSSATNSTAHCQAFLYDEDGCQIAFASCGVCLPWTPAETDQKVLQKFVTQNPKCTELVDYISNQRWKQDLDDNIRIGWTRENPSHIMYLKVYNQTDSLTLDLSELTSLEEVNLYGSTKVKAPLDLSNATKLRKVFLLGGSNLLYNDIKFPAGFNKEQVDGSSQIYTIGTPRENGGVEVPVNTVINLANYIGDPTEGCTFTYSWRKNWDDVTLKPVEGSPGSFKLTGNVGDEFRCEIKSSLFTDWSIWTPTIYLTQGEMIFDEKDVAGLKKLATDNPQNEEIKAFIENEVWKESNLYPDNSPMGVKWVVDENNNARLSHLRLNLHGCYEESIAPTKMDLSAFTELVYFNTSSNDYIDKMDFSYNTKLEEIRLEYAYTMTSIDLSPCKNLKTLWLNHLNVETIDLSANTKLEYLRVYDDHVLRSLDLSALSNLNTLSVSWCSNLSQLSDLSKNVLLKELTIAGCWDLKTLPGLDKLSLESLSFARTDSMYKEALKTMNFAKMITLSYAGSNYSLPDSGKAPKLETIQLPQTLKELNLNHYPNLRQLWAYGDPSTILPYSGIKNYRSRSSYTDEQGNYHEGMRYDGSSLIPMPGAKKVLGERYPCIEPEDTIDLSSEAIFNGKESHFIWIDCDDNTEVKDLFVAIKDQPGLFTINPEAALNESGAYRCKIWNEAFADGAGVDWNSGWILDTEHFKIPNGSSYFDPKELELLQNIVEQSTCQELKDWWNRGDWMSDIESACWSGEVNGSFCEFSWEWNENHRLRKLYILWFKDLMAGVLNISAAEELERVWFDDVNFESCVFPAKSKLQEINIFNTNIAVPTDMEFPSLQRLYASKAQTQLDLSKMPELTNLDLSYTNYFKFSGILSPRKIERVYGPTIWIVSDKVYNRANYIGAEEHPTIDFSSETSVGATVTWKTWNEEGTYVDLDLPAIETGKYAISNVLQTQKKIQAVLKHEYFPNWSLYFDATLYTLQGDANIDGKVNVQDISATLPYILQDSNRLPIFGFYQADMDKNQAIEVADVVGIVNTIRGVANPVMKSTFQPIVYVTSEADGKLYVDTQVPLAGLQFTITGADQEIPLLGEAAHLAHAAHASDSLRMVAYSMDGVTIQAGRTLLAQLPKGATLVEALFADANAQSLTADLSGIVTATEEIGNDLAAQQVTNYPNPFHGQTTFTYSVEGQADQAVIRIYAANGTLVRVLTDLPVAPGENQYQTTINLPAGLYLYRLEVSRAGRVISTQTNNLIIK